MNHSYDNVSDHVAKMSAPPLKQIYFYLTEGCNLACRHCWISPPFDPDGNKYSFLSLEVLETAIHEAKPLGLTGVKFTGGEPLMHPRLIEFLEVVRRESLFLVIETNGMLCTPLVAKEIAKSPGSFVSVSIDGVDAKTHEWVRGIEGSFSKALNGVRNLVDAGIDLQIIMTVMRHNVDQIGNLITMAEEIGASSVKFNIVQPTARGEKLYMAHDTLPVEELVRVGRYVETKLAPETALKLFFDFPMAFRSLSRIATGDGCGTCSILSILGVLPDGLYALCGIGKHVNALVFGKVGRDRLSDLWCGNITLENLRKGLPDRLEGICAECLMRGMCLGSCIAQNYYRTGSLWSPHWFCAGAEKACIFPDTRRDYKGSKRVLSDEILKIG